jgi:hypothetical protein
MSHTEPSFITKQWKCIEKTDPNQWQKSDWSQLELSKKGAELKVSY